LKSGNGFPKSNQSYQIRFILTISLLFVLIINPDSESVTLTFRAPCQIGIRLWAVSLLHEHSLEERKEERNITEMSSRERARLSTPSQERQSSVSSDAFATSGWRHRRSLFALLTSRLLVLRFFLKNFRGKEKLLVLWTCIERPQL